MKFKSDIEVQAGLKDSSGAAGTSGQVLSSNGTTVSWINSGGGFANDVQNTVKAGVAINKGQAVYVTGADGTNIIVGLASNATEATSSKTLGLLNATVAINGFADVIQIGKLAGLDTSTAVVGDPVWLGSNGNLIYGLANKPYAPLHLVYIGVVTRVNANNGEIFINVQNGFELKELHDVSAQTPANNNGIFYNTTSGLWEAKSISAAGGVEGSGTTNYVPKFTGASAIGNSQIFDNGTSVGIGTASPLSLSGTNLSIVSAGNVRLQLDSTNDYRIISNTSGDFLIQDSTNSSDKLTITGTGEVRFRNNSAETMRITSGGNVGIGTTEPAAKLDVSTGTDSDAGLISILLGGTVSNSRQAKIEKQTTGTRKLSIYSSLSETVLEPISFYTGIGFERLTITESGNVGIGTSSPATILHIVSSGNPTLTLSGTDAAYTSFLELRAAGAGGSVINANGGTSSLRIQTAGSERMRITSGGDIGIGTTTPPARLSVQQITANSEYARLGTSSLQDRWLSFSTFAVGGSNSVGHLINSLFSAGALAFGANGEKMRITSGGNVGIATTNPLNTLSVAIPTATTGKGITLQSVGGTEFARFGVINPTIDNTSFIGSVSNNNFAIYANNEERMRITSGGNVGINTTSPTIGKLQINAVAGTETFLALNSSNTGAGCGNILFNENGTSRWNIGTTADNSLQIYNQGVNAALYIRKSDSNVGIGTTDIPNKLTVSSGGTSAAIRSVFTNNTAYATNDYSGIATVVVENTSTTGGTGAGIIFLPKTTIGACIASIGAINESNSYASALVFQTRSSGATDGERMRITSGGNVLIGTTSDAGYKLDVNGSIRSTTSITSTSGDFYATDGTRNSFFGVSTGQNAGMVGTTSNHDLKLITNNTSRLTISNSGAATFSSTVTATGFFNSSDIRLKEIVDYDYSVSDIKPISYLWKDSRDNKKHVGYSAQEVQKVMPDAVNEGEDGMLSVNYIEVLVAKIAELENRIKQLEK